MKTLTDEFGSRLVTLNDGRQGLRGGLRCEVRAADADDELDFIATDESLDRYHEVIKLDGWELEEYRANPVVVDCHNYWSITSILGNTTELTIAKGKMHNRVRFARENPLGDMAFKMAAGGFIHSESVGFIPLQWENGTREDQPARTYTQQTLLEISLVVVPANPGATVGAALKSGALAQSDVQRALDWAQQLAERLGKTLSSGPPQGSAPGQSRSGAGEHDAEHWLLKTQAQLTHILAHA